jgi:hypothetical protein
MLIVDDRYSLENIGHVVLVASVANTVLYLSRLDHCRICICQVFPLDNP